MPARCAERVAVAAASDGQDSRVGGAEGAMGGVYFVELDGGRGDVRKQAMRVIVCGQSAAFGSRRMLPGVPGQRGCRSRNERL